MDHYLSVDAARRFQAAPDGLPVGGRCDGAAGGADRLCDRERLGRRRRGYVRVSGGLASTEPDRQPAGSRGARARRGDMAGDRAHLRCGDICARGEDLTVIDWLLDSDPSIRWQVMRDLTARAGGCHRRRAVKGRDRGLGRAAARASGAGRAVGWSAVVTGLDGHVPRAGAPATVRPRSRRASEAQRAVGLVREHVTWRDPEFETPWADNRFFEGEVEPCINGNVVATGSYFGVDMTRLVERLLGEQLADGGWNCEVENGATRVVVRDDDQRPRGPARARAGDRRLGRGARGARAAARSTCSSAGCSVGSRPAR